MSHGPVLLKSTASDDQYTSDDSVTTSRSHIGTPTRKRTKGVENTPRPKQRRRCVDPELTPRPITELRKDAGNDAGMRGFTVSHLRRVPELALMANKLYKRVRDEQRKSGNPITEPAEKKVKRLFEVTVNDLRLKGSIIPWDGSAHPLPEPGTGFSDALWRIYSSTGSGNISSVSTSSTSTRISRSRHQRYNGEDLQHLSDPPSDEESFIPLKLRYLAQHVEVAIKKLVTSTRYSETKSRSGKQLPKKVLASVERITRALKNEDERWRAMSEYNVREALQLLEEEGRVRRSSMDNGGKWELCV